MDIMTDGGKIEFKVKYDGQLAQVDANTLINSLINITSVIQAINQEVSPLKKVNINVKGFESGSFPVYLELVEHIEGLISPEGVEYVKNVLEIVIGVFAVKHLLKGEKPEKVIEKGDSVVIENSDGNKITINQSIFNIYGENSAVNEAIKKNFETLADDESITGFEITDKNNKPFISIPQEDFHDMTSKNKMLILEETREKIVEANLNIFKVVFDDKSKWQFYFKGNKISAKIIDNDFYARIDSGEEGFAKGDILFVDLAIEQHFDKGANTYINKAYRILKVKKHTLRNKQEGLNLSE